MPELRNTAEYLTGEIESRLLMTAAQVCMFAPDGERLEFASGPAGLDVEPSTLFRIACGTKPFTAIAVARLVDDGIIDIDAPLARWLPDVASISGTAITVRHVLHHTAGLHVPTMPRIEFVPFEERCAVLCGEQWRPPEWQVGIDSGYSEVLAWHLLGHLVEACTGDSLREHLRERVFDPLEMHDTWVGMPREVYAANLSRIGLFYDLRGTRPFPLLFDRTERQCCEVNNSYGGFSTARDLASFYRALLTQLTTGDAHAALPSAATLRTFCSPAGPRRYDVTFERDCSFGLGFMCELETHHFGPEVSLSAFGQSGASGSSFGFADPEAGIAAAVITNGLLPAAAAHLARLRIVRALFEDVAPDRVAAIGTGRG